jgi:hypothetical protein
MTIAELAARGKSALDRIPGTALYAAILVLATTGAFGLGVLEGRSHGEGSAVSITEIGTTTPSHFGTQGAAALAAPVEPPAPAAPAAIPAGGEVVASKGGTKYYLPWCGTVKLIKEENKVWFASREAAEAAGYAPASNCKGL